MEKLLNKTITINHHTNILWEPTELVAPLEVGVWDVQEYNDTFLLVNGGWLLPIEEANAIILEE